MAVLSEHKRTLLTGGEFAVPGKRALPINDATHVKLAWDMVDRTRGLTPGERTEAQRRILAKATQLGIDTKDWSK